MYVPLLCVCVCVYVCVCLCVCMCVCVFVCVLTASVLQGSGQLQPPVSLLEFPPLAAYCNAVLSALNDLRLCAPLSAATTVTASVEASLRHAVQVVLQYHRSAPCAHTHTHTHTHTPIAKQSGGSHTARRSTLF